LQAQNAQLRQDNERLTRELEKLNEELDIERAENKNLKLANEKDRKRADDAERELTNLRMRVEQLQDDLDMERTKNKTIIEDLQKRYAEASRGRQQTEAELRQIFGKQLKELLSARQDQYEKDKDEALSQLRIFYENELREKLGEIKKAEGRADDVAKEKEKVIDALKLEKDSLVKQFKARVEQMESNLGDIFENKIALAMELKAYRLLLQSEEERLGYQGEDEHVDTLDPYTLLISQMDLDGENIRVRNVSTETQSLAGWKLASRRTHKEFYFPDMELKSGASITIWTGPGAKQQKPGDLVWKGNNIWDANGDIADLINPNNETKSFVVVISS